MAEVHTGDVRKEEWGTSRVTKEYMTEEENRIRERILSILPGKTIGFRSHNLSSKCFEVVSGNGQITTITVIGNTKDKMTDLLEKGEKKYGVKVGSRYSITNTGTEVLEIKETQHGTYLGVDDIQRY